MAKNKAMFGIYSSRVGVESAVDALKAAGFRNSDISVLMPEGVATREFAHEKHTKAPEGAATGAGGAVGGIAGALIGMGIPEYEAKRYEGSINKGGILLSVHSESSEEVDRAKEILERTGAEDISSTGEAKAEYIERERPASRKVTAEESGY